MGNKVGKYAVPKTTEGEGGISVAKEVQDPTAAIDNPEVVITEATTKPTENGGAETKTEEIITKIVEAVTEETPTLKTTETEAGQHTETNGSTKKDDEIEELPKEEQPENTEEQTASKVHHKKKNPISWLKKNISFRKEKKEKEAPVKTDDAIDEEKVAAIEEAEKPAENGVETHKETATEVTPAVEEIAKETVAEVEAAPVVELSVTEATTVTPLESAAPATASLIEETSKTPPPAPVSQPPAEDTTTEETPVVVENGDSTAVEES